MILINQYLNSFDRLTVVSSCACAVHCALTPVLLAFAPAMSRVLADERVEAVLIGIAVVVGGLNLRTGCRDLSRSRLRAALYVSGVVLLVVNHMLHGAWAWLEIPIAITGSALLAGAWLVCFRRGRCHMTPHLPRMD